MDPVLLPSRLQQAVMTGDVADLEQALLAVDDVEARFRSATPLQAACHAGNFHLLPHLIRKNANVNAPASEVYGCALHAVFCAISFKNQLDQMIATHPGMDDTHFQRKQEAQLEAIQLLLSHGADPNLRGGEFGSPLAAAAAFGHEGAVKLLLDHGANALSYGGRMGSALQATCAYGGLPAGWATLPPDLTVYSTILDALLARNADVNAVGGVYGTALQGAAAVGNEDATMKLLSHGADVTISAGKFGSALNAAHSKGHTTIEQALLESGASATVVSRHQHDDWSRWREEPVTSLFLRYGAPLPIPFCEAAEQTVDG